MTQAVTQMGDNLAFESKNPVIILLLDSKKNKYDFYMRKQVNIMLSKHDQFINFLRVMLKLQS